MKRTALDRAVTLCSAEHFCYTMLKCGLCLVSAKDNTRPYISESKLVERSIRGFDKYPLSSVYIQAAVKMEAVLKPELFIVVLCSGCFNPSSCQKE